jgi:hypothetical protein
MIARATVSPPTPESKMPIGLVEVGPDESELFAGTREV